MQDNQLISRIEKALPFLAYEYVDVTFTQPNVYMRITHDLAPEFPEDIRYVVTRKEKECIISDNLADTTSTDAWTKRYIVLKSNTAPVTVELLLTVRKR